MGNGKRILSSSDKTPRLNFSASVHVRVRAPMRKYTNFQKAGLLNNYYTPVLNRIERASVKEGQEGLPPIV